MNDAGLRAELIRITGIGRESLYALVNVEVAVDTWQGRVLWWNDARWTMIYTDPSGPCTDIALMPNSRLLIAPDDGTIVVSQGRQHTIIDTPNQTGCFILPVDHRRALLASQYFLVFDTATATYAQLSQRRLSWGPMYNHDGRIYVVEMGKRVAHVAGNDITFLPYERTKHVSALCVDRQDVVYAGGWNEGTRAAFIQSYRDGAWHDLAIPFVRPINDLVVHGTSVVTCAGGGVYRQGTSDHEWHEEIAPDEQVHGLTVLGADLVACHTYSGKLSVWDSGNWRELVPPVPLR